MAQYRKFNKTTNEWERCEPPPDWGGIALRVMLAAVIVGALCLLAVSIAALVGAI